MYFLITRMREKGVARPWKEIHADVPLRGDINVNNEMCALMNRTSDIARVRRVMPLDPRSVARADRCVYVRHSHKRFYDERSGRGRRLPLCTVVVVQGCVIVFGRQDAKAGRGGNESATIWPSFLRVFRVILLPSKKEAVMGKILYVIVLIAVAGFCYKFYSANQQVQQNAFSCLKLEMAEQDKCFENVGRQAANLAKVAKVMTGQN